MTNRSLLAYLLLVALAFGATRAAHAQQSGEAANPAQPAAAQSPGRVRAWVFPGAQGTAAVTLSATTPEGPIKLADGAAQATEPFYRPLPAGSYSFDLKDGENVVKQKQVRIASDAFYTIVAWLKDGKWDLGVFSDSPARGSGGASERPLRLLNFAEGATSTVKVSGLPAPIILAPESVQETKVPAKVTAVEVSAQPPGGAVPARSICEVDLSIAPAAYVLISPDHRGRLRPGVIPAGEALAPPE